MANSSIELPPRRPTPAVGASGKAHGNPLPRLPPPLPVTVDVDEEYEEDVSSTTKRYVPQPPSPRPVTPVDGEDYENLQDAQEDDGYVEPHGFQIRHGSMSSDSSRTSTTRSGSVRSNNSTTTASLDEHLYTAPSDEVYDNDDLIGVGPVVRRGSLQLPQPPVAIPGGGHNTMPKASASSGPGQLGQSPGPGSYLQQVLPTGIDTQRIKETRAKLRPSLTSSTFGTNQAAAGDSERDKVHQPSDDKEDGDATRRSVTELRQMFNKCGPIGVLPAATGGGVRGGGGTRGGTIQPSTIQKSTAPKMSTEDEDMTGAYWYMGKADQQVCEKTLNDLKMDGEFVVRQSQNRAQGYALIVMHDGKIRTLRIRRKENRKYALGAEKASEKEFPSLSSLIAHHQQTPLEFVGAAGKNRVLLRSRPETIYDDDIYDDINVS